MVLFFPLIVALYYLVLNKGAMRGCIASCERAGCVVLVGWGGYNRSNRTQHNVFCENCVLKMVY